MPVRYQNYGYLPMFEASPPNYTAWQQRQMCMSGLPT